MVASIFQLGTLACVDNFRGIDGGVVDLFFEDFSVLSDQEVYTAGGFVFIDENSVGAGGVSALIAEQREGYADLIGKGFVGERAIHAHTQDLGVGSFQFFKILLEVFHLLSSTPGESEDVEGQHNVFLAAILVEGYFFEIASVEILQLEIGSNIADLQRRGRGS